MLSNVSIDIVQKLDIKALPYVIFMVVPVLGRMSDPDDDIRSTATNTFASLVKMVPLEVSNWFNLRLGPQFDQYVRPDCLTRLGSLRICFNVAMKNASF